MHIVEIQERDFWIAPVETPQPSKQTLERSAAGLILVTQASSTTVYWLKQEVPKKWYIGAPSDTLENRVVFLSAGMRPLFQLYTKVSQMFVRPLRHFGQVWHSACHTGMTLSPGFTRLILFPTLSTSLHNRKSHRHNLIDVNLKLRVGNSSF